MSLTVILSPETIGAEPVMHGYPPDRVVRIESGGVLSILTRFGTALIYERIYAPGTWLRVEVADKITGPAFPGEVDRG